MSWFDRFFGSKPPEPRLEPLKPVLSVELPQEEPSVPLRQDQVLRKAWFESVIEDQGIPVNKNLPCIESEAETTLRSADEIAKRLFAVVLIAHHALTPDPDGFADFIAERQANEWFTPEEMAILANSQPSEQERIKFSWRYEAAWVLAWALKLVEDAPLSFPDEVCDVDFLVELIRDNSDLTANGVQSTNNVLNEADLIYRYHWAVRQAQIDGNPPPGGLDPGVVVERHYALNWLVRYMDQEWDEVTTDT